MQSPKDKDFRRKLFDVKIFILLDRVVKFFFRIRKHIRHQSVDLMWSQRADVRDLAHVVTARKRKRIITMGTKPTKSMLIEGVKLGFTGGVSCRVSASWYLNEISQIED